jgi:hypothetical protein
MIREQRHPPNQIPASGMVAERKDPERQAGQTSFRDHRLIHPGFLIMNPVKVASFALAAPFSSRPAVSIHHEDESMHHRNILEGLQRS